MPSSTRSPIYLTVLRRGDTNIVDLAEVGSLIPRSEAHVDQVFLQDLTTEITRLAALSHSRTDQGADTIAQDLQRIGGLIFSHLLTEPARKRLRSAENCDVYLRLDEQLIHLPWELCYDGADFLATKFRVGRQVITGYPIPETNRTRDKSDALRVLLIADPTESLPEASNEAEQLCSLLDTIPGVEVTLIGGKGVRKVPLLAALQSHDVVHFAGHSHYDPQNPQKSGWRLHEGVLTPSELSRLNQPPELVFSNSCQAGTTVAWGESYQFDQGAFGIGSAFLLAGVENYVGTFWVVHDEESVLFATTFYQHIVTGGSLGYALQQARQVVIQQRGWRSLTWASYMLYGDPGYALLPTLEPQSQVSPATTQAVEYIREISSQEDERTRQEAVRQYEYDQCTRFDLLGRQGSFATHYQTLPLLREVNRERLLRRNSNDHGHDEEGEAGELRAADILRWEEELQETHITYEHLSLLDLFERFRSVAREAKSDIPRFVVLGPPGSGKTTLTQYLSKQAAARIFHVAEEPLIPTRLRLRDWEAWAAQARVPERGLEAYLTFTYRHLDPAPTTTHWRQWLQQGLVLLLLDGLDELEGKPAFLALLSTTLATFIHCPTVITCRTVSFEQHRTLCVNFPLFTLADLAPDKRDAFIRTFPVDSTSRYDPPALIAHLSRTPSLLPLAANPLLLSILCFVADNAQDGRLPTTRGALYYQAVRKLLAYGAQRTQAPYPGAEPTVDEKLTILEDAALQLFSQRGQRLSFSGQELGHALRQAFSEGGYGDASAPWANALRIDLTDNSGLIRGGTSSGFFFLHLTIQEFLAARAIARRLNEHGWRTPLKLADMELQVETLIDRKAWDPHWHEIILLLAGQLTDPSILLRLLITPKKDDLFGSRLALAARCLPETDQAFAERSRPLVTQITTTVITRWLQQEQAGATAAITHTTRALSALGILNGHVKDVPLLQWLCQQANQENLDLRASAIKALGYMGATLAHHTETLEVLATALQDADMVIRVEAVDALAKGGPLVLTSPLLRQAVLQSALHDPEAMVRTGAAQTLLSRKGLILQGADLETIFEAAMSDKDQQVRTRAAKLRQQLQVPADETPERIRLPFSLREATALAAKLPRDQQITSISQPVGEFVSSLQIALYSDEVLLRTAALQTIATSEPSPAQLAEGLPLLVQALHTNDGKVRVRAASLFKQFGVVAVQHHDALAALEEVALHDRDITVRTEALNACGHIGQVAVQHPGLLMTLGHALQHDKEGRVRARAASALGKIGMAMTQRPELLAALLAALQDSDSETRFRAAETLGEVMAQGARLFRRWWKKIEVKTVAELAALTKI